MIKQIQLFLSMEDESAFSDAIGAIRPRVVFVDDSRWEKQTPPLAASISSCASAFTFLWDQGIVEVLPSLVRKDGKFDGPQSGPVIAVWRSRGQEELLLSGRLAASTGVSDKATVLAMDQFVSDVWTAMEAITQPVIVVDPASGAVVREKVTEYRAGHHAVAWAKRASDHYFRDRNAQLFFRPKENCCRLDPLLNSGEPNPT